MTIQVLLPFSLTHTINLALSNRLSYALLCYKQNKLAALLDSGAQLNIISASLANVVFI